MTGYYLKEQERGLSYFRDVVRVLVVRDFKLRYKRSMLGVGWSLLVPLAQLAVLYVVFNNVVPLKIPHFTTFLFTGILPWMWLQSSLLFAATTIVENRNLIRQVGFPVALLPPVTVFSQFVHFVLALPILAFFLFKDGYTPTTALGALPAVILIQFVLTLSLAYFIATLQVKFHDTQYLLGIVLFLGFYITPVFWDGSAVEEPYRSAMALNPIAVLLDAYRAILVRGEWPNPIPLIIIALGSAAALGLGYGLFAFARNRFVEEL